MGATTNGRLKRFSTYYEYAPRGSLFSTAGTEQALNEVPDWKQKAQKVIRSWPYEIFFAVVYGIQSIQFAFAVVFVSDNIFNSFD